MQTAYLAASLVLLLTAVAHSVIGEILIFRQLSKGRIVPSLSAPPLKERNIRILWASWHLTSVFGLVFALALYQAGMNTPLSAPQLLLAIAAACTAGAALVLVGTKGRHPGWISLSLAALLTLFALGDLV